MNLFSSKNAKPKNMKTSQSGGKKNTGKIQPGPAVKPNNVPVFHIPYLRLGKGS